MDLTWPGRLASEIFRTPICFPRSIIRYTFFPGAIVRYTIFPETSSPFRYCPSGSPRAFSFLFLFPLNCGRLLDRRALRGLLFELFPDLLFRCVWRKVGLVFDMFLLFRSVRRKVGFVFDMFLLFRPVRRKIGRAFNTGRTDSQLFSLVGCELLEVAEDIPNSIGRLSLCDILCLYLQ